MIERALTVTWGRVGLWNHINMMHDVSPQKTDNNLVAIGATILPSNLYGRYKI